ARRVNRIYRTSRVADHPSIENFLGPAYRTGGSANDGAYSNPAVDDLLARADAAPSEEEAHRLYQEAERLIIQDMPAIPVHFLSVQAGWSQRLQNVTVTPSGELDLQTVAVAAGWPPTRGSRAGCRRVAPSVSASRALRVGESRPRCARVAGWARAAGRGPGAGRGLGAVKGGRGTHATRRTHTATRPHIHPTRAHPHRDSPRTRRNVGESRPRCARVAGWVRAAVKGGRGTHPTRAHSHPNSPAPTPRLAGTYTPTRAHPHRDSPRTRQSRVLRSA